MFDTVAIARASGLLSLVFCLWRCPL